MNSQDQRSQKKLTERAYNNLSNEIEKNMITKVSNRLNGLLPQPVIPKAYNRFQKLVGSVHKSRIENEQNQSANFRVSNMYLSGIVNRLDRTENSFEVDRSLKLENYNTCLMTSIKTNSNKLAKMNTELSNHKYHLLRKSFVRFSIRTPNQTPARFKSKVKNAYDILAYKQSGFF